MTAALGWEPQHRPLILSVGADFVHTITPRSGAFPTGVAAWIEIRDSTATTVLDTWTATTATVDEISWTIPSATADSIPNGARYRLYLQIPTAPTTEFLWCRGPVVRDQ